MRQTLTIAKREISSLFFSPVAYVVMGIFACFTTFIFVIYFFESGRTATPSGLFAGVVFVLLIFLVPAISMRLIAEEFGRGTIETLMTAPVSDTQVVLGKYLGGLVFLMALLAWLAVPIGLLEMYGRPDYGPIVTGLLGLLLVGGLYLAIGTFASALTGNQVIAFILGIFFIAPLVLVELLGSVISQMPVRESLRKSIFYVSVYSQFASFNLGVISVANIVYFLSGICLFLFLAVKVVESRRWR